MPAAVLAAAPANAVTFVLHDNGGTAVGTQARTGFEIAAAYWSSVLTNNATINLDIGFSPLGPGILGSTGSTRSLLSMNQGYTPLAANAHSTLDAQAVAGLQPLGLSTVDSSFGAVTARQTRSTRPTTAISAPQAASTMMAA